MKRIELCPCGFEATTERPIQAARVVGRGTPGVWDARAGNVLEGDTVGQRGSVLMQLPVVAGAGGGRDFEGRPTEAELPFSRWLSSLW